jgi:hypothetical protein
MTALPLLAALGGEANAQNAPEAWESARPVSVSTDISGDLRTDVVSGRVTTLEHGDGDVARVEILDGPRHGNLTVNPDNTMALVLTESGYTGPLSFSYKVTYADGTSETVRETVDVVAGTQDAGWGAGDHYALETDASGDVVVEAGDIHREVYVSESEDALSLADIAALEGVPVSQITGAWLAGHPEYGGSEDMALKTDAGMKLWYQITTGEETSHSLLFERGYTYDDTGRLIGRGASGESELNPLHIGAYGEGEDPNLTSKLNIYQAATNNLVIQGIDFENGVQILAGSNILLDNVSITGGETNVQNIDGITFYRVDITDVAHDAPVRIGDTWEPSPNRISGLFIKNSDGVLIEDSLFDHNGWAEGYDYYLSADDPMPPSFYNHNVYIQADNLDVTFRDNITMRASSFGAQIRSGGFVEGNLFLDNNVALLIMGGDYKGSGPVGNYSLVLDNVVTSGGYRDVDLKAGILAGGIGEYGNDTSLLGNIVAHLADPDNPDEITQKFLDWDGVDGGERAFINDTIIYNWIGSRRADLDQSVRDQGVEGLDAITLDQTTIQRFAAELLGEPDATIADLADYLRDQAETLPDDVRADAQAALDGMVDADLIIAFFREGFGFEVDIRPEAETLRFTPHEAGDGIRWDNRINWSSGDLPGTQDGDSVDLGGNWVRYGSNTTELEHLDFGDAAGRLAVTGGKLTVEGEIAVGDRGGFLAIDRSGQFWTDGYSDSDLLTVDIDGGRFANTGDFKGAVKMFAGGDGQAILADDNAVFHLDRGSRLIIEGDDAEVGFDGDQGGMAILRLERGAALDFRAEDGALGTIREFHSGAYEGEDPDVASGINLGNGALCVNLSTLGPEASEWTLMEADQLIGSFRAIYAKNLGAARNMEIVIDYDTDQVTLKLGAAGAGTGKVTTTRVGDPRGFVNDDDQETLDLWEALTAGQGVIDDDPINCTDDDVIPAWML